MLLCAAVATVEANARPCKKKKGAWRLGPSGASSIQPYLSRLAHVCLFSFTFRRNVLRLEGPDHYPALAQGRPQQRIRLVGGSCALSSLLSPTLSSQPPLWILSPAGAGGGAALALVTRGGLAHGRLPRVNAALPGSLLCRLACCTKCRRYSGKKTCAKWTYYHGARAHACVGGRRGRLPNAGAGSDRPPSHPPPPRPACRQVWQPRLHVSGGTAGLGCTPPLPDAVPARTWLPAAQPCPPPPLPLCAACTPRQPRSSPSRTPAFRVALAAFKRPWAAQAHQLGPLGRRGARPPPVTGRGGGSQQPPSTGRSTLTATPHTPTGIPLHARRQQSCL